MGNIEEIRKKIYDINDKLNPLFKKTCSVSALCSYIKPEFDDIAVATRCAAKGKDNPIYKYYNMSVEDILKLWKEKSDTSKQYGKLLDEYTEFILDNKPDDEFTLWKMDHNFEDDLRLKNNCIGFDQFYSWLTTNTNYRFLGREIPMYIQLSDDIKINGRLDGLFYDSNTGGYIIIDYKTTDDISTANSYNKKLQGPAYMLDDCDMNVYTTQLHLYKKALVETYHLTTYDKISVYVCNLLRMSNEKGLNYKLFPQNFIFDNNLLNKFINFACLKHSIIKKVKR